MISHVYRNKKHLKKHHHCGVFSNVFYFYKLVILLCGGMILCLLPISHTRNHSCYICRPSIARGKINYIGFDQARFVDVEVVPFIEEEVVVIDIPNFDLDITSTWISVVFDALNQAISSWLIHFGYIVYLMNWMTFEPLQLPIHYDNTNKIPHTKISKILLEF